MRRRTTLVAALAVSCLSCPAEEPVDARAFIEALLGASTACEGSFLAQAEPVFVEAQLAAQVEVSIASFERNLDNDKVEFSRPAYNACLAAARARECDTLQSETGPCSSVFRGTLDVDETCAEAVECAPGLSCFQERDQCGVCRPNAVTGDACADRNCESGAFCDQGTCVAEPAPAQFEEGDACVAASGCGGVLSGLTCVDQACVPMVLVGEDEACDVGIGAVRYCLDSSSTHVCEDGLCRRRPGVGSACTTGGACDATTGACVDGQCLDEGQPGDACTNAYGCRLGARCSGGTCASSSDVSAPPTCE
ncbi:MAG: hypothetical protein A2138_03010 [Deltaproteobacteria bacterium RBG_16_71_12]|nr:MAG: hypothetical protein A2138_03010 [Deltaproteobacteria bacterium RBG_16_71_12]